MLSETAKKVPDQLLVCGIGDHLDSYTISLESLRVPLFRKPVTGQELFFCCFLQQTGSIRVKLDHQTVERSFHRPIVLY